MNKIMNKIVRKSQFSINNVSRPKELGNFKKLPGMLEIKSKYAACHSK